MPIRFEQPDPYDARAVAASATAAESRRRLEADREHDLRVSSLAAQERMGQLRAGVDLATAAAGTDQQTQDRMFRQQAWAADQRPSERDLWAAQARMAEQRQAAQLSAWVNSRQVSEAEMARYQRLDNQVGQVLAAEDLTPREKREFITALRTGIDPLERRVQETRQRQMEALAQQETENARRMAAATAAAGKLDAMTFEERTRWVVPPDVQAEFGPLVTRQLMDDPTFLDLPPAAMQAEKERRVLEMAAAAGKALFYYQDKPGSWAQQELPSQKKTAEKPPRPFDADRAVKQAMAETIAEYPQLQGRSPAEWSDDERRFFQSRYVRQRDAAPGQVGAAPTQDGGPAPAGGREGPPRAEPWKPGEERGPVALTVLGRAAETRRLVRASPAPPDVKAAAEVAVARLYELMAANGGAAPADPSARALYDDLNRTIDAAVSAGRPAAPAAAPPARPAPAREGWSPSAKFQ